MAIVLLPFAVHAVTLGEARVKSFLNQPLDVEIDLIGLAPGQQQDVRVRIANQVHFDRLGIVYEHFLSDLQFDVAGAGDGWIVRARSTRPLSEPFIDFPLQMNWPGGQLVKQYTLLLDPPTRISKATRAPRPAVERTTAPRSAVAPAVRADDSYGPVQRGETLWPIAQRLRPQGITTRQMAMALLRANPQAFIDGNINKLRAGAVLQVPPLAFIQELSPAEARREFAAQTQRRQPRVSASPREQAASVPQAAVAPAAEPMQGPAAATDTVGEAAGEEPDAQLRIVADDGKPPRETDGEQALKEKLLVTMEEIESNRITTDAIENRLSRLEQELSRMQQLVELKDAQIAALQSEVKAREAIAQAAAHRDEKVGGASVSDATAPATPATTAEDPAKERPPVPVATIETATPVTPLQTQPEAPWYRAHLWVLWAIIGLLGLTIVLMMFRRRGAADQEVLMADLPAADRAPRPTPAAAPVQPSPESLREAQRDLQQAAAPAPVDEPDLAPLPDLDVAETAEVEAQIEGLTNSLLDEMLEEGKHLEQRPEPATEEVVLDTDIGEEDLAGVVAEINAQVDQLHAEEPEQKPLELEDDIPSILTELDHKLAGSDTSVSAEPAPIQLDPIDEISEDDAFSMSLDLARAYLEIGDQEGARDMLKQALTTAKDPDHRRQIEELLTQID